MYLYPDKVQWNFLRFWFPYVWKDPNEVIKQPDKEKEDSEYYYIKKFFEKK